MTTFPYVIRRLICPSVWPLLHPSVNPFVTASTSRRTFFAGDLFWLLCRRVIGAMAVAWSQLGDAGMSTIGQVADNFVHGSWVYPIPVPLCSALGGTLVGKRFGSRDESAAIAARLLAENVILIPGCSDYRERSVEIAFNPKTRKFEL